MSEATDDVLCDYRLAICKVNAMLLLFISEVRKSNFAKPFHAISIAALAESARQTLSEAMQEPEKHQPYLDAGVQVAEVLWGISEQLEGIQGEDRADLCWGLHEGIEEILKKAGLIESDEMPSTTIHPRAITKLPGEHGRRALFVQRAGCAISDLATALESLTERDKTAELTLIRRIESLSGVVISAAEEENTDMEHLEGLLADAG
jgi:hypothetical protein